MNPLAAIAPALLREIEQANKEAWLNEQAALWLAELEQQGSTPASIAAALAAARSEANMTTDYLSRVGKAWNSLGERDALHAILTEPGKENGGWGLAEFWFRGANDVDLHLRHLVEVLCGAGYARRETFDPPQQTALDFGCGVGRLSRALKLGWRYQRVIGMDIAWSMIDQAYALNQGVDIDFWQNPGPGIRLDDASVDLVMSLITLQHCQTELQHGYLREFMRVLKPGGCAIVELAAAPLRPPLPHEAPAYSPDGDPIMEMHGVDVQAAIRTFRNAGGRVLDVRFDRAQSEWSDIWCGFTYYVQRLPEPVQP